MGARSFNQPLNNWNVSNVTDMSLMFYSAESFDQPLTDWDVSNAAFDLHAECRITYPVDGICY